MNFTKLDEKKTFPSWVYPRDAEPGSMYEIVGGDGNTYQGYIGDIVLVTGGIYCKAFFSLNNTERYWVEVKINTLHLLRIPSGTKFQLEQE